MKCPHCQKKIDDKTLLAHAGAAGGRKSRRKLSPEDAKRMQAKSVETRRKNREKASNGKSVV